jgi:peroxiredoxin
MSFSYKIKIVVFILGILTLTSCFKSRQVKVKGVLKNCKNQTLFFEKVDVFKVRPLDSIKMKNSGRFAFTTSAKYPDFYQLRISDDKTIKLLLEPDEKAIIRGDANMLDKSLDIKGSSGTLLLNGLMDNIKITKSKLDSLSEIFINSDDTSDKEDLTEQYKNIIEQHRKYSIGFILDNSTSLASITALYQEVEPGRILFYRARDIQFFKIVRDSLIKRYPKSNHVKVLKINTNRLLHGYNNQKILSLANPDNFMLPEIYLPDVKGDSISLLSLKGKYVLLSFWASWNKESINANLKLKDVYKEYRKRGFEIYQVSFDKSARQWNYAVRFDQLPWINVNDSSFPNSLIARNYNVNSLPWNYLIDRNMDNIIAKNLSSEELNKILSELLN